MMMIIASNSKKTPIMLTNILYVPEMWCNLFSTMAVMNQGFDVIGLSKDKEITVLKGNFQLVFNQDI